MIFKLVQYTVLGIAVFYAAEGTGLIERGKFFPTLPRLEATSSDPMAWLGAAQWGFSQLGQFATNRGASFDTGSVANLGVRNFDSGTLQNFASALSGKRDDGNSARLMSAYYR